jgi:ribosomal protein S27AE
VTDDDRPDDGYDDFDDDFEPHEPVQLGQDEAALVEQDLTDLAAIEAAFQGEGYRGVAVFCQDCVEEHLYPWDLLRGNLELLLETGDLPVHEPAYAPDPDLYVPWEYARGYVHALHAVGADRRLELRECPQCGLGLTEPQRAANFCPRCGQALLIGRLQAALEAIGLTSETIAEVRTAIGYPGAPPTG